VSGCDVCVGGYEGDEAAVYRERMVTARKPHACYECKFTIQPGQTYEYVTGMWDGTWSAYRFCAVCSEIGKALACDGRNFGNLWDEIHEHVLPELSQGCLDKLTTVAAKQRLTDEWREWQGLS
jgi:hypothetical protein